MTDIESLKRRRKNIKSQLTRFCTYFESIQNKPITDLICNQLENRLSLNEPVLKEFFELQDEIDSYLIDNISEDEEVKDSVKIKEKEILDKSNHERCEFEEQYFTIISKAKVYMAPFTNKNKMQGSLAPSTPTINNATPTSSVKLPNLNMPTFTGKYSEWMQFYDTFNSLIDSETSLSQTQKFHYLKSSLKDEAAA